jgi:hypothetical protein
MYQQDKIDTAHVHGTELRELRLCNSRKEKLAMRSANITFRPMLKHFKMPIKYVAPRKYFLATMIVDGHHDHLT